MPIHTIRQMPPAIEVIRQGKVLLVDERSEELNRLGTLLAAEGHRVRKCSSFAEAIDHLTDEPFDVVLISQGSKVDQAGEVAEWARAIDSRLPVVLLLARPDMPSDRERWSGDISEYIVKPASAAEERELKETVRRYLKPRVTLTIGRENLA